MIKPEQIPDEVVGKVKTLVDEMGVLAPPLRDFEAREIAVAVLAAWPGMKLEHLSGWVMDGPDLPYVEEVASIILPLPKETNDGCL